MSDTVRIGHARMNENGKILNGSAGDQTGKEVCITNFYVHSKGWDVLRAKDPATAEAIAKCMEDACANPNIGYDQPQRLTLYDAVKHLNFRCDLKTLKVKVECDCSSLARVCLAFAGVHVENFSTANEKSIILNTGLFELLECKANGSNLKRGDILVTKTKGHTAVVLTNGADYSKGVRYKMETLRLGSKGNQVTIFESIMKEMGLYDGKIDTSFGPKCVAAANEFMRRHPECGTNGEPDSVWGAKCWNKMFSLVGA